MSDQVLDQTHLVWISTYHIGVDGHIALQVDVTSAVLVRAIRNGFCRVLSDADAAKINSDFGRQGDWAQKYLQEQMEARRVMLIVRQQGAST